MALHESALEELGLAPLWVRRGMGQAGAVSTDVVESVAAGSVPASASATASQEEAQGAGAPVRSAARTAVPAVRREDEAFDVNARTSGEPSAAPGRARDEAPRVARRDDLSEASQAPQAANLRAPVGQANAPGARTAPPAPSAPSSEDDFAWFDDLPSHPPSEAREGPAEGGESHLPAIHTLDWDALSERVAGCESCRLCEKRTNTVFGVGDRQADWMLIGEAPGENEDRQGEPFVGQAGKLLDNMLRSLTLARDTNVYIANVIKCRPPGNRNPEPDEVARCEPYLQRQVGLVKPRLIVALGRFAAQSLLKTDASISSLRGRVHEYEGVPVIVTYHPAYLLRSLPDKAKAWTDLCLARDTWIKATAGAAAAGSPAAVSPGN